MHAPNPSRRPGPMTNPFSAPTPHGADGRLPAIDALRGLVMVLMTLDHASHAFNAGRYVMDSAAWYTPAAALPAAQFLTRWVTHLCAPTFLFLAGASLALSVHRRRLAGETSRAIDADLLARGALILLLDPLWMRWGFGGGVVLQVLYAIGAGLICLVPLRRLNRGVLLALTLGILAGGEALAGLVLGLGGGTEPGPLGALLVTGGRLAPGVFVLYPLLPWLAYMLLGWVWGAWLAAGKPAAAVGYLALAGVTTALVFLAVRGLNGYGNMRLQRYGMDLLQWLHVSKYPPSLSFAALELALMFFLLAGFTAWYRSHRAWPAGPLMVFGRVPLFFYLIHVHLLTAAAHLLHLHRAAGLPATFAAAAGALVALYPLCRWYGRLKQAYPRGLLRFL
jgi:uncharacterized membrane protein